VERNASQATQVAAVHADAMALVEAAPPPDTTMDAATFLTQKGLKKGSSVRALAARVMGPGGGSIGMDELQELVSEGDNF
jgi:hypothetical protein